MIPWGREKDRIQVSGRGFYQGTRARAECLRFATQNNRTCVVNWPTFRQGFRGAFFPSSQRPINDFRLFRYVRKIALIAGDVIVLIEVEKLPIEIRIRSV